MAAKKPPAPIHITHNTKLPPVAATANLALLILGKAKVSTWAELVANPESYANLVLTEEQVALLQEHRGILPYISKRPLHSVYACPVCGQFAFISGSGPAPAGCNLTLGCLGRLMKASSIAPREQKPPTS